jgi:pimeloyl-ACP methyl ester carboxylesterase
LDRLHLIQSPTLVITGTEDRVIRPASSDVLAKEIPNARLVRVQGGSHAFFVAMKSRFNREVLDFLRED